MMDQPRVNRKHIAHETRWRWLGQLHARLDKPLTILSFVWLGLVVLELVHGGTPALAWLTGFIWGIFVLDFAVEWVIAPQKLRYVRENWLTVVAILLPAFRMLRILRMTRLFRIWRLGKSFRLLSLLSSIRRGTQAIGTTLKRRGFAYMVAMTLVVIFAGAAGMAHFESPASLQQAGYQHAQGLKTYGDALWWTAMIITTMGSDYWPKTVEGRILCWMLAVYAFTVFGYITAVIASHFIRMDQDTTA